MNMFTKDFRRKVCVSSLMWRIKSKLQFLISCYYNLVCKIDPAIGVDSCQFAVYTVYLATTCIRHLHETCEYSLIFHANWCAHPHPRVDKSCTAMSIVMRSIHNHSASSASAQNKCPLHLMVAERI